MVGHRILIRDGGRPLRSALAKVTALSTMSAMRQMVFLPLEHSPPMNIRRYAAVASMLSLFAVGCGSSADQADRAGAPREMPSVTAEPAVQSETSAASAVVAASPPPAETPELPPVATVAPPQPVETPPTKEQIARWTPTPFEPLELLAVRQWKKTSFSSRIAATPDGSHFIVAGSRVLLWPLMAEEPEHVFLDLTAEDGDRELISLAVSPDGKWFAVGDSEGMIRIWDLDTREQRASKQLYQTGVQHLAISPDSAEIATISYDRNVAIWNARDLDQKRKFQVGVPGVERIEYVGPNLLAVAGESTTLWNTAAGEKVHDLPAGRYNFALARTPDGRKLLFGTEDGIGIWDVGGAQPDQLALRGVGGDAWLSITHDGKLLASSDGRSIDIWSLADGRRLQSIPGYGWTIVGLSWLPQTNLLAVASDTGVTRLWGTSAQRTSLGLTPLATTAAPPDPAAKSPATPEQLEQLIDWRTFPTLPGSASNVRTAADLFGVAPVGVDEARSFYRHVLTEAGWVEAAQDPNNPSSMEFRKGEATVSAYFGDDGAGKTNFNLRLADGYDVRWTPKADADSIEIVYENAGSSTYRAKANLLQIETSLLRKLHNAGWAAYSRLNSSSSEKPDERDMEFVKNGATLRISVGKFPDDTAETYTVQQSLFSNSGWTPVPPDAGFVEFNGSIEPALIAVTKLDLAQARDFYDRELASQGWLVGPIGRSIQEKQGWLPYIRGQCNQSVSLTRLPDGRTLVQVGDASNSLWDAAQPQEEDADQAPTEGLEAADFPLLNAAKTGKFDPIEKTIEVRISDSTLAAAAERYTQALGALGWKADEGGIRDEEYTFFDFTKGEQEFSLRARKQEGEAVVTFAGDGLLWNKELPGGKRLVSYETWLRLNKLPPSLELLDRYETEMKSLAGN